MLLTITKQLERLCKCATLRGAAWTHHTPVSFPGQPQSCGLLLMSVFKKKHAKKKKSEWKKERKEKRTAFQLYTEVVPTVLPLRAGRVFCALRRLRLFPVMGCVWETLLAFLVSLLSALTNIETPLPGFSLERTELSSQRTVCVHGAPARETEASLRA